MPSPQVVVIAVDTSKSIELLRPVQNMDFLIDREIHLVHVVKEVDYGDGLTFNVTFMSDDEKKKVTEAVVKKMVTMASDIIPYRHVGKLIFKCLFSEDPKDEFCKYAEGVHADMTLIGARTQHGLMDGSFANYVSTRASCSVLILRNVPPRTQHFSRVVIAIKLEDEQELINLLAPLELLKQADLCLLHLWGVNELSLFPEIHLTPYPTDEAKIVVEQAIESKLQVIKDALYAVGFKGEITTRCVYTRHPKKNFSHLVSDEKFELAVMKGASTSRILGSFVHYQVVHSKVPVLVLRSSQDSGFISPSSLPADRNQSLQGNSG